jgi:hypothetical protein
MVWSGLLFRSVRFAAPPQTANGNLLPRETIESPFFGLVVFLCLVKPPFALHAASRESHIAIGSAYN